MPGVFLSYRRTDGDFAVLLYAWLVERFGADQVFWDREDIDPGRDFREVLSATLASCDALVALIGPGWSPSPWIQREIGAALRRRILVLPVLLGDAVHVDAASLPKALRRFAALQTLETRDLRFRDRLVTALDAVAAAPAVTGPPVAAAHDLRARRLADLLRDQVDRRQRRALELLAAGEIDRAFEVLDETFDLVMALIDFLPGDAGLEMRLGYLYKDLAQVFEQRNRARFDRYVDSGLQTFQRLVERRLTDLDLAGSWNGLGNMHLLRRDFDRAVACCSRAVELVPDYAYAWADLLLGLEGQADAGRANLPEMRRALKRLRETGRGDALLAPHIARAEASIRSAGRPAPAPRAATRSAPPGRKRRTS
jgi:tetratricopeptide (TPR) repeat protein